MGAWRGSCSWNRTALPRHATSKPDNGWGTELHLNWNHMLFSDKPNQIKPLIYVLAPNQNWTAGNPNQNQTEPLPQTIVPTYGLRSVLSELRCRYLLELSDCSLKRSNCLRATRAKRYCQPSWPRPAAGHESVRARNQREKPVENHKLSLFITETIGPISNHT
jgi:hypothetical protein